MMLPPQARHHSLCPHELLDRKLTVAPVKLDLFNNELQTPLGKVFGIFSSLGSVPVLPALVVAGVATSVALAWLLDERNQWLRAKFQTWRSIACALGLSGSGTEMTSEPSFQPARSGSIKAFCSWPSSFARRARAPTVVMPRLLR